MRRTRLLLIYTLVLTLTDPVPLGLENTDIPDTSLTASSEFDSNHGPQRARLNIQRDGDLRGAWSARTNDANQWIQVIENILERTLNIKLMHLSHSPCGLTVRHRVDKFVHTAAHNEGTRWAGSRPFNGVGGQHFFSGQRAVRLVRRR